MKHKVLLAAGVIVIFAAGLYVGDKRAGASNAGSQSRGEPSTAKTPEKSGTVQQNAEPLSETTTAPSRNSYESQASQRVSMAILQAFGKPKPERTAELLTALEELTKVPLTKELIDTLKQILDGGEVDETDYVLSLMEQREEKASVVFLAQALDHSQQDVRDRALMACEAVAGTIFTDHESAKAWSQTWKPDPAVAELFSPKQSPPETSTIPPAKTGPMGAARREQSEDYKLSPAQNPPQKETPEN
jgi:hypothetical protein